MSTMGRPKRRAARVLLVATATALVVLSAATPTAQANWLTDFLLFPRQPVADVRAAVAAQMNAKLLCSLTRKCPPATTTSTTSTTSSTTTTTTTTTLPPAEGCVALPKDGGGTWECTFADEFDGSALDRTKWTPHPTSKNSHDDGRLCYVDDPDNVSVSDGTLKLTVRKEETPVDCAGLYRAQYTSAMVAQYPTPSGGGFTQTYGRYEIRARVTGAKVAGLQESFWMWPVDYEGYAWPASGEIDIAEIYHRYPDRAIPYVHYNNPWDPNVTNNYCMIDDISKFHSYVLEWTSERIKIFYDGQLCIDDPWDPRFPQVKPQPFDKPFYLILTQALGVGGNDFNAATTPLPASTIVDYVHIWQ